MQDVQNIPPPDVNSTESENNFGNHSEIEPNRNNEDIERPDENIPLPPDSPPSAPIEEPPDVDSPPIDEDDNEPKRIV